MQSPLAAQASHSAKVTTNLDAANGFSIVTLCCGASVSWWPGSALGDPVVNDPPGITTISGQSAQSLKDDCPGLSGCSPAPAGMRSQSEATKSVSISPK